MIGGKPKGLGQHAAFIYPALTLCVFFVVPFVSLARTSPAANSWSLATIPASLAMVSVPSGK